MNGAFYFQFCLTSIEVLFDTNALYSDIFQKNALTLPSPDPAGSLINYPPGSGSVIQDYGSADLVPTNIYGTTTLINIIGKLPVTV